MTADQVVLLTGGTGAIGTPLAHALAQTGARVVVLARTPPPAPHRFRGLAGDLLRGPRLGLEHDEARWLHDHVTTIVHAAGLTRFDAPIETARRANVDGLHHLLTFASECAKLERVVALSTVYVAGRRTGTVLEDELDHDRGFVNAYEQSKHEAEQLLRSWMARLPLAVCRLSTVIGDSTTGEVTEAKAIHQAIRFLYHSLLPMMPGTPQSPVDVIATDYAVAAVSHLAGAGFVPGHTVHVCAGTDTLRQDVLIDLLIETILQSRPAWRRRAIEKPVIVALDTFELFRQSVEAVADAALRSSVGVLSHFAPQLAYPKVFDDRACAAALEPAGIVRPPIRQTVVQVVKYLIEHNWAARVEKDLVKGPS
ncbi:MAG TPA: SDR family oxidoreductase [Vicinamibacterales bacterium]